ncbi:MAG: glycoside hydrolase family 3 C-terminal domain-containing protein [Cyclobacteriaceae bacterium]|nr:glycoside hydrolase family 3 C-terminal domain-containing protein [Cyclobacteriaceae bacterium]
MKNVKSGFQDRDIVSILRFFSQPRLLVYFLTAAVFSLSNQCSERIRWSETNSGDINLVINEDGQTLGYSPSSGIKLVTDGGYAFKDLNRNGQLDPYEDWRLDAGTRAADLASRMSVEQIAGLMLYSRHQSIPAGSRGFMGDTYGGKPFRESGARASDLADGQKKYLEEDNLRHVLITRVESPEVAARWNNHAQAFVEGLGFGIPVNSSSDPRHRTIADAEYNAGAGGDISMWPGSIGLAASFDPELVHQFGQIASREYRALGIATALSPQVDLATDPRWYRFSGTFGPDPRLTADLARAYVDGFQTSSSMEISEGWGFESVNAMAKHWPGGGTGEGGRDAHYGFGKYAVYPGNNLETHLIPFLEGAFDLAGGTGMASAVMPYYTISFNQDPTGANVGNAFSSYFIGEMLREEYGYDGVVCTDWGVTRDEGDMDSFGQTPWGVEHLTEAEKHYRILMAGVDQFGGNNAAGPVLEAYRLGVAEHGEEFMRSRFETSAIRLLKNIFRVGLFENPYLDIEKTRSLVGNPEFMKAGYEAQLKSIVMLKNQDHVLPVEKNSTVYIPKRYIPARRNFMGQEDPGRWEDPLNLEIVKKYYRVTKDPAQADFALVLITSPFAGRTAGYDPADAEKGGNGFMPISLQYGPYTATFARDPSLAGDPREKDVLNRTYRGKKVTAANQSDLEIVLETSNKMKDKPVIVSLELSNPTVLTEFEGQIEGLLVNFGIQDQALLDILSGDAEPSGLLPLQMPAHMTTVEEQFEDVPFDMQCHVDSEGNVYDFGFGLDWKGKISDERTARYVKNRQIVQNR